MRFSSPGVIFLSVCDLATPEYFSCAYSGSMNILMRYCEDLMLTTDGMKWTLACEELKRYVNSPMYCNEFRKKTCNEHISGMVFW